MPDVEFKLKDDFLPASYDQWRALAEADLKGASFQQKLVTHTYEGIDIQPLYTRRDEFAVSVQPFPSSRPSILAPYGALAKTAKARPATGFKRLNLNGTDRARTDDLLRVKQITLGIGFS